MKRPRHQTLHLTTVSGRSGPGPGNWPQEAGPALQGRSARHSCAVTAHESVSFSLAERCQVYCQQPGGQTSFLSPVQSNSSSCSRHLEGAIVSHSAGCYGFAQLFVHVTPACFVQPHTLTWSVSTALCGSITQEKTHKIAVW